MVWTSETDEFLEKLTFRESSGLSAFWDSDQEYLPDENSLLVGRSALEGVLCFTVLLCLKVCLSVCVLISPIKSVELNELELVFLQEEV